MSSDFSVSHLYLLKLQNQQSLRGRIMYLKKIFFFNCKKINPQLNGIINIGVGFAT